MKPERSDGVTFRMAVSAGSTQLDTQLHHASEDAQRFALDITPLAGQAATVELSVDPGPKRSASYDWARWTSPRIERHGQQEAAVGFGGHGDYSIAVDGRGVRPLRRADGLLWVDALQPGSVLLLRQQPPTISLPTTSYKYPARMSPVSIACLLLELISGPAVQRNTAMESDPASCEYTILLTSKTVSLISIVLFRLLNLTPPKTTYSAFARHIPPASSSVDQIISEMGPEDSPSPYPSICSMRGKLRSSSEMSNEKTLLCMLSDMLKLEFRR